MPLNLLAAGLLCIIGLALGGFSIREWRKGPGIRDPAHAIQLGMWGLAFLGFALLVYFNAPTDMVITG